MDKFYFVKIKNVKDSVKRMKKKTPKFEKISKMPGLSKILKEHLELNNKKRNKLTNKQKILRRSHQR